jgi:hypothetical protein
MSARGLAPQDEVPEIVIRPSKGWRWLARAWMPALNLFLITGASIVALLSPRSAPPLYKGPRHTRQPRGDAGEP